MPKNTLCLKCPPPIIIFVLLLKHCKLIFTEQQVLIDWTDHHWHWHWRKLRILMSSILFEISSVVAVGSETLVYCWNDTFQLSYIITQMSPVSWQHPRFLNIHKQCKSVSRPVTTFNKFSQNSLQSHNVLFMPGQTFLRKCLI